MDRRPLIAFALVVSGCSRSTASTENARQVPVTACTKAGDRCEFAPGKIGLCTAKAEGCTGESCLTCVSLH